MVPETQPSVPTTDQLLKGHQLRKRVLKEAWCDLEFDQKFVLGAATVLVAVVLVSTLGLYMFFITENLPVPPAVTLLMGLTANGMVSIILGKGYLKVSNGLSNTAHHNKNTLESIAARLHEMDSFGTRHSHDRLDAIEAQLQALTTAMSVIIPRERGGNVDREDFGGPGAGSGPGRSE